MNDLFQIAGEIGFAEWLRGVQCPPRAFQTGKDYYTGCHFQRLVVVHDEPNHIRIIPAFLVIPIVVEKPINDHDDLFTPISEYRHLYIELGRKTLWPAAAIVWTPATYRKQHRRRGRRIGDKLKSHLVSREIQGLGFDCAPFKFAGIHRGWINQNPVDPTGLFPFFCDFSLYVCRRFRGAYDIRNFAKNGVSLITVGLATSSIFSEIQTNTLFPSSSVCRKRDGQTVTILSPGTGLPELFGPGKKRRMLQTPLALLHRAAGIRVERKGQIGALDKSPVWSCKAASWPKV